MVPRTLTAPSPASWTRGPVADLFSSYVAVAALSAAHELGLLDRLATTGEFHVDGDPGGEPLDPGVVRSLCQALSWAGVVHVDDDGSVTRGPRFAAAYAARGYFYWLVRGCGEVFTTAPHLAYRGNRHGEFYHRDMRAVAIGSRLIGDTEVEPLFDTVLADLGAGTIADLGCGSGHRLIRVAQRHPGTDGIGIDISPAAVRLATGAVAEHGLSGRISILEADVRELRPRPELSTVDTVTCVFMGHDLWPYDACVRTLRRWRLAFPNATRLLLCDVVRSTEPPGSGTTIFTLGFELVHALMDVYIPTLAEWRRAFAAGGWACRETRPTQTPPNGYLFELIPA